MQITLEVQWIKCKCVLLIRVTQYYTPCNENIIFYHSHSRSLKSETTYWTSVNKNRSCEYDVIATLHNSKYKHTLLGIMGILIPHSRHWLSQLIHATNRSYATQQPFIENVLSYHSHSFTFSTVPNNLLNFH